MASLRGKMTAVIFAAAFVLPAKGIDTPAAKVRPAFISLTGVPIDDSFEARQELDRLSGLESAGRWAQAARGYDRLMAEHGGELVREEGTNYVGVTEHVNGHLGRWPAAAQGVYRHLFGRRAALALGRLDGSAGAEQLLAVADRWWLTQAGGQAAYRAAEHLADEQRFQAAGRLFERLSSRHPDYRNDPGAVAQGRACLARTAARARIIRIVPAQDPAVQQAIASLALFWKCDLDVSEGRPRAKREEREGVSEEESAPAWCAVVRDGSIYVQDAHGLACLDPDRGALRWQVWAHAVTGGASDGASRFVAGPVWYEYGLYVVGRRRTEWGLESYYLARLDPATGRRDWRTHLVSDAAGGVGRGLSRYCKELSGHGDTIRVQTPPGVIITVATVTGRVRRLTLAGSASATRSAAATEPAGLPEKRPPAEGHPVLVADRRQIACYLPLAEALSRLEKRLADAPEDWARHLDLARFALGRPELADRGMSALRAALACAQTARGRPGPATTSRAAVAEQLREQVFEIAVRHADQASLRDDLLAMAARTADRLDERIRYRLVFADAYGRHGRPAKAIQLWQQILEDDSLREHLHLEHGPRTRAGTLAEKFIGAAIQDHGRAPYAAYDAKARALLEEAISRSDRSLLQVLLQRYPNAQLASDVSVKLASLERRSGRPITAARILQRALWRAETGRRPSLIAAIADCHFEMNDAVGALAWLARGTRDYPRAEVIRDGRATTLAAWRRDLLAGHVTVQQPLPDLAPPVHLAFRRPFDTPVTLLKPPPDATSLGGCRRRDPVLIHHGRLIEAISPATGRPRWAVPWETGYAPVWLGSDEEQVILSTRYRVLAIRLATGEVRWNLGSSAGRPDSPLVDPEMLDAMTGQVLDETLLVNMYRSGRAVGVDPENGSTVWERQLEYPYAGPAGLNEEHVVYASTGGGRTRLVVLDAGSGRCLRSFPFTEDGRPTWLTFAADRSLIVVGPDRIASYDPTTSARNWVSGPLGGLVSSSIRMSVGDVYLATRAGALVAVSAANGRQRWRTRAFKSEFETVRGMWLDAGNLYAVGDQAVAAFDASDGAVVWTADLPAGVSMRAAALAKRYVVVVGSQSGADGGLGGAQRVAVFFLDRAAGRWSGSPTGEGHCLGEQVALRDVVFQGSTLLIREAASWAGWFLGGPGGEGTVPH